MVIVRCEGCQNLHLIADNLKWFEDEPLNIETIAKRSNQPLLKIKAEGDLQEGFLKGIKKREEKKEENQSN